MAVCQRMRKEPTLSRRPNRDGVADGDDAGYKGSFGGAAHLAVYVAVEHHVEDAGAAGGHVAADEDAEKGAARVVGRGRR